MSGDARWSGRRVLVVGASGFLGAHMCRRLAAAGAEVHGVARAAAAGEACARWWRGDLADLAFAREVLEAVRPETTFHLAGEVSGLRDLGVVLPTYHGNLTTTVNLLTVSTELGCGRVVLAGSLEEPDPDEAGATPSSPYAASKWAGSAYARMFRALYGTPVVIARVFMVYGPRQQNTRKLIPYVARALLRGEAPSLSSGTREIDWVYIDDAVDGLLAVAAAESPGERPIDVGSGTLVSIRALVERLVAIVGAPASPAFGSQGDRPMEQVRAANVDDTFARTGWRPRTSLDEGLRATVDWYAREPSAHVAAAGEAHGAPA